LSGWCTASNAPGSERLRDWVTAGQATVRNNEAGRWTDRSTAPLSQRELQLLTTARSPASELEVSLEVALLQALADRLEEATRIRAVHQLVVVGERQVHHVADGDGLAAVRRGHHHRTAHDRAHTQDAGLRVVDDRRVHDRAEAADVR